jgi:hypothetical protein
VDFVKALKAEIDNARRAMFEAQARYALLQETLRKYEGTNTSRDTRDTPTLARRTRKSPRHNAKTTKMATIRAVLADHHASGISARDISAQVKRRAIKMSNNAVFAALSKLKQRKLATVDGGKYFPTKSLLDMESPRRTNAS